MMTAKEWTIINLLIIILLLIMWLRKMSKNCQIPLQTNLNPPMPQTNNFFQNNTQQNNNQSDRKQVYTHQMINQEIPLIVTNNRESKILGLKLQKIAKNFDSYRPVSENVKIEVLKASENIELRKFKESVYYGEIKEGKRSGLGIMIYLNGRVYEGEWQNNYKYGKGYEKWSNGSIYKGTYSCGKPDGYGKYEWQNGETYQGEWQAGLKNGSGIWRGSKGDSYIGEWKQGKADGYGVHTWINGDRYEGQFKNCLKHGEGVQKFAKGDSYKGNYKDGKPSGQGEYYWANGSFFKGQFENGLRNGQGIWKKSAGHSDKYEGEYVDEKKQGQGIFTWEDGNVYKGSHKNDLRDGYGQMYWNDGRVVKGIWKEGVQIEDSDNEDRYDQFVEIEEGHDENFVGHIPITTTKKVMKNGNQGQCLQYFDSNPEDFYGDHNQNNIYNEPQRPAILQNFNRRFRQRNVQTQQTKRPSKMYSELKSNHNPTEGSTQNRFKMNKKMSVGTVRSKVQPYINTKPEKKSMSTSFFLYKMNNDRKNMPHFDRMDQGDLSQTNRQSKTSFVNKRQIKTSGGGRNHRNYVEEELKYFTRSKINNKSQLF